MNKTEKICLTIAGFLLVTLLVGGIIIFSIPTQASQSTLKIINHPTPNPTTTTTIQSSPSPQNTAKTQITQIKTYSGQYFSFKYPGNWHLAIRALEPGTTKEELDLGIPELQSDQTISFFSLPLDQIKPDDAIEEFTITISGQPAKKWIRHGEGYYSYDYYTKDPNSDGSFGVHVTTPDRDYDLEKQLDQLVASLQLL